ncbi:SIR2 family NAD-dependent protein deacylase [Bradyrhizobium ganzhouense]|uniref:SIR2 family NAD-dependent protein deacylase n=1 Tax=Bradyrhizobium ganzhouense TaxID=1179767 RepID=UPI003CE87629
MPDPDSTIESLPDYPALQQLARALWRDGSVRGASILVGAGLSKNAVRTSHQSPEPPSWWDLKKRMVQRLYPHDPEAAPSDPLRIAEEYRTYFGQSGLDEFIRDNFPEKSWAPGPLHSALLELPWADILTTNWDTLLERAAESSDRAYETVRTETDLTYARSPRIVKLHRTLGDAWPLIFAEEDYRTYPAKFAAFVNFARQVFIENELCLVGFSGNDPNFLQWAGWVRDHLGGSARRIYLVGNLRLERATRRYFEAHNIAPIDLAPLVEHLPRDVRHSEATRIFLDELRKAKPPLRHEWQLIPPDRFPISRAESTAYDRLRTDYAFVAELAKETIPLLRNDRLSYPGWQVCPSHHRQPLLDAGGARWMMRRQVLDLLEPAVRAEALSEILWRRTTSLAPLDTQLAAALTEVLKTEPLAIDSTMRLDFALALLRDARFSADDDELNRWARLIETEAAPGSALRHEVTYQLCLRARDRMDLTKLETQLAQLPSEEPVWKLRRAALHCELGEYATATRLIKESTAELERRHRLDRDSLAIKSQLSWAAWLSRASDVGSRRWSDLPVLRDFSGEGIDPMKELQYFKTEAASIEKERREDQVKVQAAFETGHYRDGSGKIRLGAENTGILLFYEFDQLIEQVGLPIRINFANICEDAAIAVVEEGQQSTVEWYVWLLRAISSHRDKPFDRHFGRLAAARMSAGCSSSLLATIGTAVTFWARRIAELRAPGLQRDRRRAINALRVSLMALSRLTVRMSPDRAGTLLRSAVAMANDSNIFEIGLIEALGEIVTHASAAIPVAEKGAFVLAALEFPLPSEKNSNMQLWPRAVTAMWKAQPDRELGDLRWDRRIQQLLIMMQKGHPDREHASLPLAYLSLRGILKPEEATAFGTALWSDLDAEDHTGLPRNTFLIAGSLLKCPVPDGVDLKARLTARLLDPDLSDVMKIEPSVSSLDVGRKADHLHAITLAVKLGLTLPPDVAARLFDEIVAWELQTVDRQDPFALAFAKGFNDSIRSAAGDAIAAAVAPNLPNQQGSGQRTHDLMTFIGRTGSWRALSALPLFWAPAEGERDQIVSMIRRSLVASDDVRVGAAAMAISRWVKLSKAGTAADIPRVLADQLIATIETCHEIGLAIMLSTARKLIEDGILNAEDHKRLVETMAVIRDVFRYEDTPNEGMRAVVVSSVRAECVRLAKVLERYVAGVSTLRAWIDDAGSDPLPEVRFALRDQSEQAADPWGARDAEV